MCGIVGMLATARVTQAIYDALTIIQHRGQDAAGIMTCDQTRMHWRKSNGLVRDVIREPHVQRLKGNMGIGHVRYPTAGTSSAAESQPFYVNSPYGLGLVHNGNLTNSEQLALELHHSDLRHLNTSSDSEVLLNVLAFELHKVGKEDLTTEALFAAMKVLYSRVQGAFAAVALINSYGMLAFRDPNGIRPLVLGRKTNEKGTSYMVASESIALDALGYEYDSDLAPGEVVYINLQGELFRQVCAEQTAHTPCIFEYIYLARPDTVIDKIPVYQARLAMGVKLAEKIKQDRPDHDIDVVIPIPETSRNTALALAQELGVTYSEGFVKNRYIGRTFIMPEQQQRRSSVRLKLNAVKAEFSGKNVLLVDDSIVRGTTSQEIIQMARDAGAKNVYFASAAPEVRYPNVYGIDMPVASELVAHDRSVKQICEKIGCDWLIYLSLADAYEAVNSAAQAPEDRIERFEDSIFTGDYISGGIDADYLAHIAHLRADAKKNKTTQQADIMDDFQNEH